MAGALFDRAAPHVDSNRGEALVRNHNYAGLKGRLVAVAEMPQVYDKNSREKARTFCCANTQVGETAARERDRVDKHRGAVCDRFSRPLLAFEAMKLMIVPCAWNEA
jgi:hypothetical protein